MTYYSFSFVVVMVVIVVVEMKTLLMVDIRMRKIIVGGGDGWVDR